MEDYKPNSYKSKKEIGEKKEIKKVTHGVAKVKKKSGLTKFTDIFIQDDIENVKSFIITDVLIPTGKKLISDIVNSILYPGGGGNRNNNAASKVHYTSYNSISANRDPHYSSPVRRTYDYDTLSFATRADAEAVLMGMDEILNQYNVVSVADFYDLAGASGTYTDNKYGWTDIRSAHIERVRDGYIIRLPRAMAID